MAALYVALKMSENFRRRADITVRELVGLDLRTIGLWGNCIVAAIRARALCFTAPREREREEPSSVLETFPAKYR